jgi:hypothetical protein
MSKRRTHYGKLLVLAAPFVASFFLILFANAWVYRFYTTEPAAVFAALRAAISRGDQDGIRRLCMRPTATAAIEAISKLYGGGPAVAAMMRRPRQYTHAPLVVGFIVEDPRDGRQEKAMMVFLFQWTGGRWWLWMVQGPVSLGR